MTTKREILLLICETPGWQPAQPVPASVERHLNELFSRGWIHPRLDGWEATGEALDAYPRFVTDPEIADPEAPLPGVRAIAENGADPAVSLDRVTTFILALMGELPLPTILRCAAITRGQLPANVHLTEVAHSIGETL